MTKTKLLKSIVGVLFLAGPAWGIGFRLLWAYGVPTARQAVHRKQTEPAPATWTRCK